MAKSPLLEKLKKWETLHPVVLGIVGFIIGGPITAAVLFIIWKTPWSHRTKLTVAIVFVVVFTFLQIIFAKQILDWTLQRYRQMGIIH